MIAPLSPTAAGLKLVDTATLELAHAAFCNADHDLVNLRKAYTVEAAALVNAELESRTEEVYCPRHDIYDCPFDRIDEWDELGD